ncbi:hypothetical protein F5144DRAFT_603388 [Chaetomium tenue]|uniref:Uncharacterized protein n=1 Tax=Chaetomium tenue TaxID=1854479 RepID=A0ACB7P9H8_9PEZI|nr:hypothetical protein F5144DRAFT_603388 [Chaetomium globosum]
MQDDFGTGGLKTAFIGWLLACYWEVTSVHTRFPPPARQPVRDTISLPQKQIAGSPSRLAPEFRPGVFHRWGTPIFALCG